MAQKQSARAVTTEKTSEQSSAVKHRQVAGQIAQQVFGYDELRAGQADVLAEVLKGRDTLAVMPTGSGKSAIYQIAALRLPGVSVVISPLIALQQDQMESIQAQGVVKAAVLNSTLSQLERESVFEQLREQRLEFLFLAPEQFANEETLSEICQVAPSLFVVDEAHCISEWGHDFRPDYLQLAAVIEALGHPVVLALTATASPLVRKEIVERLGMRSPAEVVSGFNRPNIHLSVCQFESEEEKRSHLIAQVVSQVENGQTPGIVYGATRRATETIAEALTAQGVAAAAYHAGMNGGDRESVQQGFMAGDLEVVVATCAFGMGIDKENVRFVFHHHIPGSIDAYYQEIGRAARDGEPATAVLFYCADDMKLQRFLTGGAQVDEETLEKMAAVLDATEQAVTVEAMQETFALSAAKTSSAIDALAAAGLIAQENTGEIEPVEESADLDRIVDQAMTYQERRKQFGRSRSHMMQAYAESQDCRRKYLLSYFGDELTGDCEGCDNCDRSSSEAESQYPQPFPIGAQLIHTNFGIGQVLRYEADKVSVLFETVGYKTFVTEMIEHSVRCLVD